MYYPVRIRGTHRRYAARVRGLAVLPITEADLARDVHAVLGPNGDSQNRSNQNVLKLADGSVPFIISDRE